MKTLLLLASIIILFNVSTFSQDLDTKAVKVNGVHLGMSYGQVIRLLGKPRRDSTRDDDECVGGKTRTLEYAGLVVQLHPESADRKAFYVGNIEVISKDANISGLKMGTSLAVLRKKYGASKLLNGEKKGERYIQYFFSAPGNLYFYIRRGRLVKAEMYYIC